jgi:hypothetical protein
MTVDTIVTSIDQSAVNCCAANLQPREKLPVDTGRLQAASSSAFFRNQLPSNGPLRAVQLHAPPQTATQDSEHGGWPCLPSPGRSPQIRSRVRPLPAALIRGEGSGEGYSPWLESVRPLEDCRHLQILNVARAYACAH